MAHWILAGICAKLCVYISSHTLPYSGWDYWYKRWSNKGNFKSKLETENRPRLPSIPESSWHIPHALEQGLKKGHLTYCSPFKFAKQYIRSSLSPESLGLQRPILNYKSSQIPQHACSCLLWHWPSGWEDAKLSDW